MSEWNRQEFLESHVAMGEDVESSRFPELSTLSPAFFYQFVPVAKAPEKPEVVFIPHSLGTELELTGMLASWNLLWEAGQYRKEAYPWIRGGEAPAITSWLERIKETNVYLFPETATHYPAYAPLYHMLPKRMLDRHGLPALRRPLWPVSGWWMEELLPTDFQKRLSRAFAEHIWKQINTGSGLASFSTTEPLAVLSHNLDFWLPYAIMVTESAMSSFERVEPESEEQREKLKMARQQDFEEVAIERPRMGGTLWCGEEEAAEVTKELVDVADENGRLRGIVDAVKSHRVTDDFSPLWSYAREDFERKLYSKRSKVRVSFVELKDTLPVHGPSSEYTEKLLWEDFTAILDQKERHVVVCLRSGTTKLGDIARELGYANHTPISKALARIRKKAARFLN
jgi:hypothetical protein